MGAMRRFRERVQQVGKAKGMKKPTSDDSFMPSDYQRCLLSYEEVQNFAKEVKAVKSKIEASQRAREGLFAQVEELLTSPLPSVHDINPETGEHTTSEAMSDDTSTDVHKGTLTNLSKTMDARVSSEVIAPIDQWLAELDLMKGKMDILEKRRLDLDASRRDHEKLEAKVEKKGAPDGEPPATSDIKLQAKHSSVEGKKTAFEQYEQVVNEDLTNLIGDTGVVHKALNALVAIEIDIYQKVAVPLAGDSSTQMSNLSVKDDLSSGYPSVPNTPATGNYAPPTGTYAPPSTAGTTGTAPLAAGAGNLPTTAGPNTVQYET